MQFLWKKLEPNTSFCKLFDLPFSQLIPQKISFTSRMGQWTKKPDGSFGNLIIPADIIDAKQIESFIEPLYIDQKYEVKKDIGILVAHFEVMGDFGIKQTIEIEFNAKEMSISGPQNRTSSWFPTPL